MIRNAVNTVWRFVTGLVRDVWYFIRSRDPYQEWTKRVLILAGLALVIPRLAFVALLGISGQLDGTTQTVADSVVRSGKDYFLCVALVIIALTYNTIHSVMKRRDDRYAAQRDAAEEERLTIRNLVDNRLDPDPIKDACLGIIDRHQNIFSSPQAQSASAMARYLKDRRETLIEALVLEYGVRNPEDLRSIDNEMFRESLWECLYLLEGCLLTLTTCALDDPHHFPHGSRCQEALGYLIEPRPSMHLKPFEPELSKPGRRPALLVWLPYVFGEAREETLR